ncbi:MAG: UDP-N-acetylenolpyruvoylglucosamine reductase [Candidatus Marinimicrobia bacterium]|nr:UDP-N-acetylenolpyruvoylglucosamine reductase [Candidatus Neomarinimicrobiota bacterium]|tara:strand:- start:14727 stop:15641 length:915 start_codon:yes stop_codon:yes gene_type:complete
MNKEYTDIKQELIFHQIKYLENESMKKHTTFGVGGRADLFILPKDLLEIKATIDIIKNKNINYYFFGSGSNILVDDNGLRGIIISLKKSSKKIIFDNDKVFVDCGAMLGTLVKKINQHNITGFESLGGVPGTVGGALIMNAGAFGAEISNYLISVSTINMEGKIKTYKNNDIDFAYRSSSFPKNELLVSAVFKCNKGNKNTIKNKKMDASKLRKKNQPLKYRSAGSIFKNPSQDLAAGYLIDKAGLKGKRIGGAQISEKHANFIINIDNASSNDVISLIELVKKEIKLKFNIKLELEIKILGVA